MSEFETPTICNIKKYQITIEDVRKNISKNIDILVKKKNKEILDDYKKQYTKEELVKLNENVGCELLDMIDIKSKQVIEHCILKHVNKLLIIMIGNCPD